MKSSVRLGPGLASLTFLWLLVAAIAMPQTGVARTLIAFADDLTGPSVVIVAPKALGGLSPSEVAPFVLQTSDFAERQRAIDCLAQAVFYEAGTEPLDGQRAVAQVVLNRVRDRNFPATVCGVVYQGSTRSTGCQFSFTCDGSITRRPPGHDQWRGARLVAEQALAGYVDAAVGSATHYHATYVNPWWRPTLVQVAQVGTHVFYRWPGKAGLPSALTQPYAGGETRLAAARLGPARS